MEEKFSPNLSGLLCMVSAGISTSSCQSSCNNDHKENLNYSGQLQISPLNCNSISDGVCVKHVKRGQRVTLCTTRTTIPSIIPPGGNVLGVLDANWKFIDGNGALTKLYTRSSACHFYGAHPSSLYHSTHYSDVTESCLTINSVQGISTYILTTYLHPPDVLTDTFIPESVVYFYVTYGGM